MKCERMKVMKNENENEMKGLRECIAYVLCCVDDL